MLTTTENFVDPQGFGRVPSVVAVLTLFSDSVAPEKARFGELLDGILGPGAEVSVSAVGFETLSDMEVRPDEDRSDMIVLIAREDDPVPVGVRQWLARWLQQAHAHSTIVCLLGSGSGAYRDSSTWHGLRNACGHAGVAFFAAGFRTTAAASVDRVEIDFRIVNQESPSGVLHWGINE